MKWAKWIEHAFSLLVFRFAPAEAVAQPRLDAQIVAAVFRDYVAQAGGVAQTAARFERLGFNGKVRSWRQAGAVRQSINSVEVLQMIGWKDLRAMAARAEMPVDQLRDLLAVTIPAVIAEERP